MAAATSAALNGPTIEKPSTPERARFALSGPSRPLDLRHNAARRDLADIRLAGRWFAPHYAEPEVWSIAQNASLVEASSPGARALGLVEAGERFSVLELSGGWAWGFRMSDGLVGYIEAAALTTAPVAEA